MIDDNVSSKILKFADDTKITASISSVEEQHILQIIIIRSNTFTQFVPFAWSGINEYLFKVQYPMYIEIRVQWTI